MMKSQQKKKISGFGLSTLSQHMLATNSENKSSTLLSALLSTRMDDFKNVLLFKEP